MATIRIRRPAPVRSLIPIVSMIDAIMILLFFFMVTSTYLDLDMIPAVQQSDEDVTDTTTSAPEPGQSPAAQPAGTVMVRIAADGGIVLSGAPVSVDELSAAITARVADDPLTPVLLLPSGGADMQALVTVMDTITTAGAQRLRVIRLEAQP